MSHVTDPDSSLLPGSLRGGAGMVNSAPASSPWYRSSAAVFILVLAWKFALLVLLVLPTPSNDSFFYDGAVVNLLLHGEYVNPSLALALPMSGTQVFSAYPPLYQFALLPWMFVFGTSAISAMVFHFLLFAVYALLVHAILRRLAIPLIGFWIAGLFLFSITFHDRPDSLAHVFGMASVYAWTRFHQQDPANPGHHWAWWMVVFGVLCFCTGLQIGLLYLAVLWACTLGSVFFGGRKFPIVPMLCSILVPALLAGSVILFFPHLWAGFLEHARQTPALTGFRLPRLDELLKLGRTVPGTLAAAVFFCWGFLSWHRSRPPDEPGQSIREIGNPAFIVVLGCGLPVLGLLVAVLFVVTANAVMFTAYLQPVIVGAFWAIASPRFPARVLRLGAAVFVALALFASLRAIGLSTWGVACAADTGYRESIGLVRAELGQLPTGSAVALSPAYLYEAARHKNIRWIHCDWLQPPGPDQFRSDMEGLLRLRPQRLVLTQFDYFRRYEPLLNELGRGSHAPAIAIQNTAGIPTPDSIPPLRRVIQHISWAPVVVTLDWPSVIVPP